MRRSPCVILGRKYARQSLGRRRANEPYSTKFLDCVSKVDQGLAQYLKLASAPLYFLTSRYISINVIRFAAYHSGLLYRYSAVIAHANRLWFSGCPESRASSSVVKKATPTNLPIRDHISRLSPTLPCYPRLMTDCAPITRLPYCRIAEKTLGAATAKTACQRIFAEPGR